MDSVRVDDLTDEQLYVAAARAMHPGFCLSTDPVQLSWTFLHLVTEHRMDLDYDPSRPPSKHYWATTFPMDGRFGSGHGRDPVHAVLRAVVSKILGDVIDVDEIEG